jgi:hypothetical protein
MTYTSKGLLASTLEDDTLIIFDDLSHTGGNIDIITRLRLENEALRKKVKGLEEIIREGPYPFAGPDDPPEEIVDEDWEKTVSVEDTFA